MNAFPNCGEWDVVAEAFPNDGTPEEMLGFALNYAILAPSTHNTQPWLFRVSGHTLELFADPSRALRVIDPAWREMIASCGAALFHLRLALQYFGHATHVELFPDAQRPTLLARVTLGLRCETEGDSIPLFRAIPYRHTNRHPFQPDPLPEALLEALQADVVREGAWLRVITEDETRYAIADLVAQADRQQWSNRHFRKELAVWLRPNNRPGHDGIPGYAEGLAQFASMIGPAVIRTFDLGKGRAAKDRDIAIFSPALAVIGTDDDTPLDWLRAGQALEAVLLRARTENVWASFLNQAIEVPETRAGLSACIDRSGFPQILLRLGFSDEVPPTPRRAVSQVLMGAPRRPIRIASGA